MMAPNFFIRKEKIMVDILDMRRFGKALEKRIGEELGCLYNVRLINVIKNNGLRLMGLYIRCANSNVAPIIYINDYYKEYVDGRDIESIILDILQVYRNSNTRLPVIKDDFRWQSIRKNVILRLVNYDKNKELLQGVPHKRVYGDLAITFHVLVGRKGIQSYRINNELFRSFDIDIDTLFKSALLNNTTYFPMSIRNINEVITSMVASEEMDSDEYAELFDTTAPEKGRGIMYVLSNNIGVYGATAMLYPDIIKEFADTMGADLFILPSSLHEVILVLDDGYGCNIDFLKEMVMDVNMQMLDMDDILSDSVYKYSRATNKIEKI